MANDFLNRKLSFIRENCKEIINIGAGGADSSRNFFKDNIYKTLDYNIASKADIIADAHSLPIKDRSFNAVLSFSLLEHTHSPKLVVDEIFRILRPGGYVLVSAPFIHPYHGGNCPDYFRFTKEGMTLLFKDFSDVEIESDGGLFLALQDFIPPSLEWSRFLVGPTMRLLDKMFTKKRSSAHQFILFAKK